MERFPFHLFDMIIMLLELDDVFNCLSVNKAWYATFTPYAYEVVITQDIRKIEQFMESMTLYPRCRDAGKYIKTLYLDDAEHSKKRFSEAAEKHLVNVLSNCPNIERLELKHTKATFQAILDPRVPPFPRLRRLNIVLGFDRRYCRHRYLKKCYLKFRSSLECTSLCGLNRNQVKANNIRPFIVLFPHLRELDLTDCTFLTLDKILIDCPSLTSITINGSLSIPDDAQISSHKHPLIKDLCLNCSVALKDIEYITRRFPCLKSLWLESISNRHMDELIEILVEKDYSELQLGLNPTSLLQLYKREQFYKCANIMIFENSNIFDNTNISEHYCHILADPKAGRKTATYRLNETIITFGQRLRDIGQFLNSLQLKFNPLREINLEDIIRSCPVLSVLVLSGCSPIKFNKGTEPHNNLTTLEVRNIRPTDLSFRSIESAFPQLQNMSLDCTYLDEAVNPHIFLSKNGLRSLKIKSFPIGPVVVLKVQGVPVRSWHVIEETKEMWTTETVYDDTDQELFVDKCNNFLTRRYVETNGSDGVLLVMEQSHNQSYLVIEASSMDGVDLTIDPSVYNYLPRYWKGNYSRSNFWVNICR